MRTREAQKAVRQAVRPFAQDLAATLTDRLQRRLKNLEADLPGCIKDGGAIGRKTVENLAELVTDAAVAQGALVETFSSGRGGRRNSGFGGDMVAIGNEALDDAQSKHELLCLIATGVQTIEKFLANMGNNNDDWKKFQERLLAFVTAASQLLADDDVEETD